MSAFPDQAPPRSRIIPARRSVRPPVLQPVPSGPAPSPIPQMPQQMVSPPPSPVSVVQNPAADRISQHILGQKRDAGNLARREDMNIRAEERAEDRMLAAEERGEQRKIAGEERAEQRLDRRATQEMELEKELLGFPSRNSFTPNSFALGDGSRSRSLHPLL